MKLIPGTVVPDSPDPRTVEQNAWLSGDPAQGIPKHTCDGSSNVRSEFAGGVLTPNGRFTFDSSIITRAGNTPGKNDELDRVTAATSDTIDGRVIILDAEGRAVQYAPCLPSAECIDALLAGDPSKLTGGMSVAYLRAIRVDAKPAAEVAVAKAAVVQATPAELFLPEPATPAAPAPVTLTPVPSNGPSAGPISAPSGSGLKITAEPANPGAVPVAPVPAAASALTLIPPGTPVPVSIPLTVTVDAQAVAGITRVATGAHDAAMDALSAATTAKTASKVSADRIARLELQVETLGKSIEKGAQTAAVKVEQEAVTVWHLAAKVPVRDWLMLAALGVLIYFGVRHL